MKQKQNETEHLLSTEANRNRLLEDAAERLYPDCNNVLRQMAKDHFIEGAKWQQERSYSEEEVIAFGEFIFKNTLLVNVKGVEGILKQFKNN